jgi:hypothetical protein
VATRQQVHHPGQGSSRPLRSGVPYRVVVPRRARLKLGWDKLFYSPGDEATLTCESDLDADDLALVVEQQGAGGVWTRLTELQAPANGKKSSATLRFPKLGEPLRGELVSASVSSPEALPGDLLGLEVVTKGLDRAFNRVTIERQRDDGVWEIVTRWQGDIVKDRLKTDYRLPGDRGRDPAQRSQGKLVSASFAEGELRPGGTAWLTAAVEGLAGELLYFELERQDAYGAWQPAGSGCASPSSGSARVGVALEGVALKPERFGAARFEGVPQASAPLQVAATIDGPDGTGLQLLLEVETAPGEWAPVSRTEATLKGGEASASFEAPMPAAAVAQVAGELVSARVSKAAAEPGDLLGLQVVTKGLDGAWSRVTLERERDGGWEAITSWQGEIAKDLLETGYQLPGGKGPGREAQGRLVSARFEDQGLTAGEMAWLCAAVEGLAGARLSFELERQDVYGAWHPAGSGCATESGGSARVGIALELKASASIDIPQLPDASPGHSQAR